MSIRTITISSLFGAVVAAGATIALTSESGSADSAGTAPRAAREIISSYVEDFRADRFAAEPMLFGIRVPGEGEWHVRVTGAETATGWEVVLNEGPSPTPTFRYDVELETLRAIDRGAINALTAQGKAFSGDYAPMDAIEMDGYEPTTEQDAKVNPFSFHFWTRGFPEIIPFGEGMTREAHGGDFVVFYYETGLRTAWYRIAPDQRVRDDAREQAAPFPIMVVGMKGTATGEVDGKRTVLPAGNTIFIPAFTNHRWWNETGEAAEAILIMFGEGA